jgi:hypothetical protein
MYLYTSTIKYLCISLWKVASLNFILRNTSCLPDNLDLIVKLIMFNSSGSFRRKASHFVSWSLQTRTLNPLLGSWIGFKLGLDLKSQLETYLNI